MGFTNSSKNNIEEQEVHQYLLIVSINALISTRVLKGALRNNPEVNDNELLSYSGAVMSRKVPWLPFF